MDRMYGILGTNSEEIRKAADPEHAVAGMPRIDKIEDVISFGGRSPVDVGAHGVVREILVIKLITPYATYYGHSPSEGRYYLYKEDANRFIDELKILGSPLRKLVNDLIDSEDTYDFLNTQTIEFLLNKRGFNEILIVDGQTLRIENYRPYFPNFHSDAMFATGYDAFNDPRINEVILTLLASISVEAKSNKDKNTYKAVQNALTIVNSKKGDVLYPFDETGFEIVINFMPPGWESGIENMNTYLTTAIGMIPGLGVLSLVLGMLSIFSGRTESESNFVNDNWLDLSLSGAEAASEYITALENIGIGKMATSIGILNASYTHDLKNKATAIASLIGKSVVINYYMEYDASTGDFNGITSACTSIPTGGSYYRNLAASKKALSLDYSRIAKSDVYVTFSYAD